MEIVFFGEILPRIVTALALAAGCQWSGSGTVKSRRDQKRRFKDAGPGKISLNLEFFLTDNQIVNLTENSPGVF